MKKTARHSLNLYGLFISFSYLFFTIRHHKEVKEVDTGLLSYLRKHNTGEEYLFATLTTVTAAPYIINTDESVMALGGFNGTDPILTVSDLKKLVKEGKVKYFLLLEKNSGNTELVSWIKKNGQEISSDKYSSSSSSTSSQQSMKGGPGGESQQTLYLVE